ncbi:MAG: lytic transglycosylase domain-containing protein [Actinomycetia bacterium]|nr:lytic transglycosylase domain-containing protein [Actinomycetes bacterium]
MLRPHPAVPYQRVIWRVSAQEHVDPLLIVAIVRTESHFRADAVSRRGAVGLMQIVPKTAGWVMRKAHVAGPLTDPSVNVAVGTWYVRYLLRRYGGNRRLALAAYNSGPETVDRWMRTGRLTPRSAPADIPYAETRWFVTRVLVTYDLLRWAYGGPGSRPV